MKRLLPLLIVLACCCFPAAAQLRTKLDGSIAPPNGSYAVNGATGAASFGSIAGAIGAATSALADTGALPRSQDSRNRDATRVTDFCQASQLDGITDNRGCIQAAVTAMCARANAGGTLFLPSSYRYAVSVATGVTIPCSGLRIAGQGYGDADHSGRATIVSAIGAGEQPVFKFLVPAGSMRAGRYAPGGGVANLMILSANSVTSPTQTGPLIDLEACEGCRIENIRLWKPFVGIRSFAGFGNIVTNSVISQVVPGGVGILNTGSDSGCSDVGNCLTRSDAFQVDHVVLDAAFGAAGSHSADCILVRNFAATTWIGHTICNQFRTGLKVDCPGSATIGACPAFLSLVRFETEPNDNGQSDGFGIWATDFQHLTCLDCQIFGYSVVNDVALGNARFGTSGDAQFLGGKIGNASASCIVSSVPNTYFGSGLQVNGCSGGSSGTYYGIELRQNSVTAANSGTQTVSGVQFCWFLGGSATSMKGLNVGAIQDYVVATGNSFRGCASSVTDGSTGTHNVITNNTPL